VSPTTPCKLHFHLPPYRFIDQLSASDPLKCPRCGRARKVESFEDIDALLDTLHVVQCSDVKCSEKAIKSEPWLGYKTWR
jgi:hypothetical protein